MSSGQSGNNRSFLSAFQNFTSTYPQPDLLAASSQQKFGSSLQESPAPKDASQLGQAKVGLGTQLKTHSLMQQKLPQEPKLGSLSQQKAAVKSSYSEVVNKDIPNSSWSNVSSIVSPIVSVPRLTSTSPKSIATLIDKESNAKFSQAIQKQVLLHQDKQNSSVDSFKTVQNVQHKKKQQQTSGMTSLVNSTNISLSLLDNRSLTFPNSLSSTNDILQQQRNLPSGQTVNSTSVPKSISNQLIKTATVIEPTPSSGSNMHPMHGIVLGTGPKPPQPVASHFQQSKGNKQPIVQKTLDQISSPKSLKAPTVSKSSPTSSPLNQSLLLSSPLLPQSRGSTPSPQKSPENPTLSLYEQIQSQIRNQEAMEGQALKNLAMALNFSNSSSNSAFRGKMPATVRKSAEHDSDKNTSLALDSKPLKAINESPKLHHHLVNLKPTARVSTPQSVHNNNVKNISMASQLKVNNPLEKHSETFSRIEARSLLSSNVLSKEELSGRRSVKSSEPGGNLTCKDQMADHLKKSQQISVLTMESKEVSTSRLYPRTVVDNPKTFKQPMEVYRVVSPSLIKSSASANKNSSGWSPVPLLVSTDLKLPIKRTEYSSQNFAHSDTQMAQKGSMSTTKNTSLQESLAKLSAQLQEQHPTLSEQTQKYS